MSNAPVDVPNPLDSICSRRFVKAMKRFGSLLNPKASIVRVVSRDRRLPWPGFGRELDVDNSRRLGSAHAALSWAIPVRRQRWPGVPIPNN